MRGASVTLGGPGGPMANLGIPGSGLSTRFSLLGKPERGHRSPTPAPADRYDETLIDRLVRRVIREQPPPPPMQTIGSAATAQLSSPHLVDLRDLIATAHARRSEAEVMVAQCQKEADAKTQAVATISAEVTTLQANLHRWQKSRFRLLHRRKIRKADRRSRELAGKVDIAIDNLFAARAALQEAENARDESWLDGSFPLDGPASAAWTDVVQAFQRLSQSVKIWDLTAERHKRAGEERSSATTVLERKPTQLSIASLPFFAPDFSALRWHNANGDDLYLYPGLLLVVHDANNFAVIDLKAVKISYELTKFDERDTLPADSRRVGSSWQYSNKDGTRDLRYRDNQEFPVMLYAEFRFKAVTGLDECFMFSNVDAASEFSNAMLEFEHLLSR